MEEIERLADDVFRVEPWKLLANLGGVSVENTHGKVVGVDDHAVIVRQHHAGRDAVERLLDAAGLDHGGPVRLVALLEAALHRLEGCQHPARLVAGVHRDAIIVMALLDRMQDFDRMNERFADLLGNPHRERARDQDGHDRQHDHLLQGLLVGRLQGGRFARHLGLVIAVQLDDAAQISLLLGAQFMLKKIAGLDQLGVRDEADVLAHDRRKGGTRIGHGLDQGPLSLGFGLAVELVRVLLVLERELVYGCGFHIHLIPVAGKCEQVARMNRNLEHEGIDRARGLQLRELDRRHLADRGIELREPHDADADGGAEDHNDDAERHQDPGGYGFAELNLAGNRHCHHASATPSGP